jgi:hypothetical protein
MADNILSKMRDFFNAESRPMTSADFAKEYKLLSTEDKAQLKQGIEDGTLTY